MPTTDHTQVNTENVGKKIKIKEESIFGGTIGRIKKIHSHAANTYMIESEEFPRDLFYHPSEIEIIE